MDTTQLKIEELWERTLELVEEIEPGSRDRLDLIDDTIESVASDRGIFCIYEIVADQALTKSEQASFEEHWCAEWHFDAFESMTDADVDASSDDEQDMDAPGEESLDRAVRVPTSTEPGVIFMKPVAEYPWHEGTAFATKWRINNSRCLYPNCDQKSLSTIVCAKHRDFESSITAESLAEEYVRDFRAQMIGAQGALDELRRRIILPPTEIIIGPLFNGKMVTVHLRKTGPWNTFFLQ